MSRNHTNVRQLNQLEAYKYWIQVLIYILHVMCILLQGLLYELELNEKLLLTRQKLFGKLFSV